MDFKDAVPVVNTLAGLGPDDLGKAIRFYEKHKDVIRLIVAWIRARFEHEQKPGVVAPPPPLVLTVPLPGPVVVPWPPLPGPGDPPRLDDDVHKLRAKLLAVEKAPRNNGGQRGATEDYTRFKEILGGANIDDGSWLHTDCSPIGGDGTEIVTGDPRWGLLNHSWRNGNVVWPYYEFNGKLTSILHGDDGSPEVNPGSFDDDEGCTVTYLIREPGTFRFGYYARNRAGTIIDSGLIGQGNAVGGEPFNIK